jgi:deazaflavin-dependent oxidoreductase (nitroreductase family)
MVHLFDPLTVFLVGQLGMDDHNGTRVIEVVGRKSGVWRATPVRVLEMDRKLYIVAMYGETHWVKNLRHRGGGRLRFRGRVSEFRAAELGGEEKLTVLRAYLRRWWPLVSRITSIHSPDGSDQELLAAAAKHPAFRLE